MHLLRTTVNNELKNHLFSIRICCWTNQFSTHIFRWPNIFTHFSPYKNQCPFCAQVNFEFCCALQWMRNVTKNQLSENSNLNYAQEWLSRVFPSICYRYYNALLLFILSAEQITITSYTMVIIHIRKLIGGLKLCWTIPKPMRSQKLIEFSCMFFCEINEWQKSADIRECIFNFQI